MAWTLTSQSHLMRLTMKNILGGVYTTMSQVDLDAGSLKCALYDNTITPDMDAALGSTGYGQGQWLVTGSASGGNVGGQVFASGWAAGGVTAGAGTGMFATTSGQVGFTTAPIVSGASTTMSNIYGMFLYFSNATSAGGGEALAGLGFWGFGAAYAVTAGTLTITPHASGLFTLTV